MEPVKLCQCGCGLFAPIAKQTYRAKGHIKGQPVRFVHGHHRRGSTHTLATLRKISEANKGRFYSVEARRKMSEALKGNGLTHGHSRNGNPSPTYVTWAAMKQRCQNPNATDYHYYGGRGISVCNRWNKFVNFLSDMGERPQGTSIDRIDNNGNYEPGNCRWATRKQQANNRR